MKDIKFEESYIDSDGELTLYFSAPKEKLNILFPGKQFPDAISMEISIEIDEEGEALVSVSPVNSDNSDYDWTDIDLPNDEIEELYGIAGESYTSWAQEHGLA